MRIDRKFIDGVVSILAVAGCMFAYGYMVGSRIKRNKPAVIKPAPKGLTMEQKVDYIYRVFKASEADRERGRQAMEEFDQAMREQAKKMRK